MGKPQVEWGGITKDDLIAIARPHVIEYVNWYRENGLHLPEEFKDNPVGWSDLLLKIQMDFELRGTLKDETKFLFFKYLGHLFVKNHE